MVVLAQEGGAVEPVVIGLGRAGGLEPAARLEPAAQAPGRAVQLLEPAAAHRARRRAQKPKRHSTVMQLAHTAVSDTNTGVTEEVPP